MCAQCGLHCRRSKCAVSIWSRNATDEWGLHTVWTISTVCVSVPGCGWVRVCSLCLIPSIVTLCIISPCLTMYSIGCTRETVRKSASALSKWLLAVVCTCVFVCDVYGRLE